MQVADNLTGPSGITTLKGDKAWPAAIDVTDVVPNGVILSTGARVHLSKLIDPLQLHKSEGI